MKFKTRFNDYFILQVKRTVIYSSKMFGWFCFGTFIFIGIEGQFLLTLYSI